MTAAAATRVAVQVRAGAAYSVAVVAAGVSATVSAAQAWYTAQTGFIAAEAAREVADAAALDAHADSYDSAETALYTSLYAAHFTHRADSRALYRANQSRLMTGLVDAVARFDTDEATPESQYVLALARLSQQYSTASITASLASPSAQDAHAQTWISTVSAAEATYVADVSTAADTFHTTSLTARVAYATTHADLARQLEAGTSTLWGTNQHQLTTNAATWWETITPASQTAADASTTTDYLHTRTVSNAQRVLQQSLTGNSLAAFQAGTQTDVTLTGELLGAVRGIFDAVTAPSGATVDVVSVASESDTALGDIAPTAPASETEESGSAQFTAADAWGDATPGDATGTGSAPEESSEEDPYDGNHTVAEDWKGFSRWEYAGALLHGLFVTTPKAVVNASADTGVGFVTLGFVDPPDLWEPTVHDLGYNVTAPVARVTTEVAVAVGTLGWSQGSRVGQVVNGVDTVGNLLQGGDGVLDAAENGLNVENGTQILTGVVGAAQAAKALQQLDEVADAADTAKAGRAADGAEVVDRSLPSQVITAPRSIGSRIADYEQSPNRWHSVAVFTEHSTRRGARHSGISIQTQYINRDTQEVLWRHQVINDHGRVVDDHFRDFFKPRVGDSIAP